MSCKSNLDPFGRQTSSTGSPQGLAGSSGLVWQNAGVKDDQDAHLDPGLIIAETQQRVSLTAAEKTTGKKRGTTSIPRMGQHRQHDVQETAEGDMPVHIVESSACVAAASRP